MVVLIFNVKGQYMPANMMNPITITMKLQWRDSRLALILFAAIMLSFGQSSLMAQEPSNNQLNAEFLAKNASKEGVETTASGLQFQTIKAGEGPSPTATDIALVGYKGMFIDGTIFDEAAQVPLPVGEVVTGFSEALQKMQKGGQYKIWIPSDIGYGPDNRIDPQTGEVGIPGGSALIFEVNLIDFKSQAELDEFRRQTDTAQSANQAPPVAEQSFEEVEKLLGFEALNAGVGPSPSVNDTVLVSYRGMLPDGTVFDQNAYATFPVSQVIPGFSVALQKMQVGGQYKIEIPSEIGYGPNDRTNPRTGEVTIAGGSTLIFEVSLLHFISQDEITRFNNSASSQ